MTQAPWHLLTRELDQWQAAGRQLRLWLRDDDTVSPSPALARLSDIVERHGATVLLAVIPMEAELGLAKALRAMPTLLPCQHGVWHRNHAPIGAKKSEFGATRPAEVVDAEIASGRDRLRDLLGSAQLPIFVPPWNRIDPGHAARLGALGFAGLSCFRNYRHSAAGGPHLLNTHIDVMDWQRGRIGRSHDDLLSGIVSFLAGERETANDVSSELGLLLHHRDHDDTAWSFLDGILATAAHPAVRLTDPRMLLPDPDADRAASNVGAAP